MASFGVRLGALETWSRPCDIHVEASGVMLHVAAV